jgi:RNA polymerase sigma-70 factor (subfamily 1)
MTEESVEAAEMIARLQDGADDALAELFSLYHDRLKRVIHFRLDHRMAGRISESDVIQDTYISASKRVDHYRGKPEMPFFVWLRLLANQQLADLHRTHLQAEMRDVRKEISLEQPAISPHTSLAMAAQLVGSMTSPSRAFSRVERIANLEKALNLMEPIDREVIALRHFEELTNVEVAEVLGISLQAASKRYVRAIKRMKDIVSAIPGFDER